MKNHYKIFFKLTSMIFVITNISIVQASPVCKPLSDADTKAEYNYILKCEARKKVDLIEDGLLQLSLKNASFEKAVVFTKNIITNGDKDVFMPDGRNLSQFYATTITSSYFNGEEGDGIFGLVERYRNFSIILMESPETQSLLRELSRKK